MQKLNWSDCFYQPITLAPLKIGEATISLSEALEFTSLGCQIPTADELAKTVVHFTNIAEGNWPQTAFFVFSAARHPQALNGYFPLTNLLDESGQKAFYKLAQRILLHPHFDVQLLDERGENRIQRLPQLAYFVAALIAEIFFYRQDLLERLLEAGCRIWLYTTPDAFHAAGGVAGGCFNSDKRCVQLLLSRLFEGFNAPMPGASPFLHEFGHMLDFLDAGKRKIGKSSGFLPGMRESDGTVFKSAIRSSFLKGKRLEQERYQRLCDGATPTDPLPIGHPYVFQNNTEFIAGYFEMFFRNPHYFAAQNPDLYHAFELTFNQDPRQCRKEDFPYYINQNRSFYLSGQRLNKSGLTIPPV